jgi:hypothetical protein
MLENSNPDDDLLLAWLLGELDPQTAASVEASLVEHPGVLQRALDLAEPLALLATCSSEVPQVAALAPDMPARSVRALCTRSLALTTLAASLLIGLSLFFRTLERPELPGTPVAWIIDLEQAEASDLGAHGDRELDDELAMELLSVEESPSLDWDTTAPLPLVSDHDGGLTEPVSWITAAIQASLEQEL